MQLEAMKRHLKPEYFKAQYDSLTMDLGIWKLNSKGEVLKHWNTPTWPITVDKQGTLYAIEPESGGALFTLSDEPVFKTYGLKLERGLGYRCLAVAQGGHVFTTADKNVVELDAQGNVLRRWCDPGPEYDPIRTPISLSVDGQDHLYVVDYHNSRVLKFDLGTP